jgi:recombination protein RecT
LNQRGEIILFYGLFKLTNGGYGFEVMSREAVDEYAKEYSKSIETSYSPWKKNYIGMAKKTVIKQALKYAPVKADFRRALSVDETIKTEIAADMSEAAGEDIYDVEYTENNE